MENYRNRRRSSESDEDGRWIASGGRIGGVVSSITLISPQRRKCGDCRGSLDPNPTPWETREMNYNRSPSRATRRDRGIVLSRSRNVDEQNEHRRPTRVSRSINRGTGRKRKPPRTSPNESHARVTAARGPRRKRGLYPSPS